MSSRGWDGGLIETGDVVELDGNVLKEWRGRRGVVLDVLDKEARIEVPWSIDEVRSAWFFLANMRLVACRGACDGEDVQGEPKKKEA